MATQAERRETTRTAIIEAAYAEFERAGSPDVALEIIAERAGVTKGSIQYHFSNRAGLLGTVATWAFVKVEDRVNEIAGGDVTPTDYLRALLVEQAGPSGRVLFTIGDELARDGSLAPFDPYPYLIRKLAALGLTGSVSIVAAATMQIGRHLAFGLVGIDEIDDILAELMQYADG